MRSALPLILLCACGEKYDAERTARLLETKIAEQDDLQLTVTCSGQPLASDGDRMACGAKDRDGRFTPATAYVQGKEIWYRLDKVVNLRALAADAAKQGSAITCDRNSVLLADGEYYACPAQTNGKPARFRVTADATWRIEPDYKAFIEDQLGEGTQATCPPPAGIAKGDRVACDVVAGGERHVVDVVLTKEGFKLEPGR